MPELESLLRQDAFAGMQPFGRAISRSLRNARVRKDGGAVWEEEDYCSPPLAQERRAVLDEYFENLSVSPVSRGEGWRAIESLPPLFPDLSTLAPVEVIVYYTEGCPSTPATVERIGTCAAELSLRVDLRQVPVASQEEAERWRFLGSPTVRVNGVDIDPDARDASFFGFL